jgi:hypothetical protein
MQIVPVLFISEQKFLLGLKGYLEIFVVFKNFVYFFIPRCLAAFCLGKTSIERRGTIK